jgi:hypothetical protein
MNAGIGKETAQFNFREYIPALVAQCTGTGGAVCKGATPSVEQKEADGALAPVRSSLDTSFGDQTIMHE